MKTSSAKLILKLGLVSSSLFGSRLYANDEFGYDDWNPDLGKSGSQNQAEKHFFAFEEPVSEKQQIAETEGQNTQTPPAPSEEIAEGEQNNRTILINFNNVAITEFIRFISRVSGKNFIYEEADLQFNVTIVSEDPASLENVMAALMQVLRIRDLSLIEQGNNIIIHRNPKVNGISQVIADGQPMPANTEIVTRVFKLNTLDTDNAIKIVKPLISEAAIVEGIPNTNNMVVTDISTNVEKIGQLLKGLDSPASGLIIGQYQVQNALIDSLIPLATQIMEPIADGKPLVMVPHIASNSIFIVSTPFLVERSIAIYRNLDVNTGSTRIFTPESLRFQSPLSTTPSGGAQAQTPSGQIPLGTIPGELPAGGGIPQGGPGGPLGTAGGAPIGPNGLPLQPGAIGQQSPWSNQLPPGHIQRTQFYIQKLKYRKGDQIVLALGRIADSLERTGTSNSDLVAAINSIQWIEASNSLVFTGTTDALLKVRELVEEIDTPLRQVFIEMLILETTLDDSLEYGVNFATEFQQDNLKGAQAFINNSNPFAGTVFNNNPAFNNALPAVGANNPANTVRGLAGYNLGLIGQKITHNGQVFGTLGALVRALHTKNKVNIILNPKILTEDNTPAEIFVGENVAFQTQSIANDQGNIITNNFVFRDVGTTLKVTPMLSSTDIITLEIKEEVSRIIPSLTPTVNALTQQSPGPNTSKSTTTTRVHVPDGYFLVISGM
ncbi:MAG: secretin N-terminal domain-containing protein, partial [Parachlamydiaceae bacterium]